MKCSTKSGPLARRDADAVADDSAFHQLLLWLLAKNGRVVPGAETDPQIAALRIPEESSDEELDPVSEVRGAADVEISYGGSYIGSYAVAPMGSGDGTEDALYPAELPESDDMYSDAPTPDAVHISPLMA